MIRASLELVIMGLVVIGGAWGWLKLGEGWGSKRIERRRG
jgi:hypothetical protein